MDKQKPNVHAQVRGPSRTFVTPDTPQPIDEGVMDYMSPWIQEVDKDLRRSKNIPELTDTLSKWAFIHSQVWQATMSTYLSLVAKRSNIPEQMLASHVENERRKWISTSSPGPSPFADLQSPLQPRTPEPPKVVEPPYETTTGQDVKDIFFWLEQMVSTLEANSQVSTITMPTESHDNFLAFWAQLIDLYEHAPKNYRTSITTKLHGLSYHSNVILALRKSLKKLDVSASTSKAQLGEHQRKFLDQLKKLQTKRMMDEYKAKLQEPSEDSKLSDIDEAEEETMSELDLG